MNRCRANTPIPIDEPETRCWKLLASCMRCNLNDSIPDAGGHSTNQVVIIGAGPAGLTAAFELLTRTDLKPIILEATECVGGISRTTVHNGNRIDIGGHRFFSKSDRVMMWWQQFMPMQGTADNESVALKYQGQTREIDGNHAGPDPESVDDVMLVRSRKSRIYYLGKLFDYPLSLSLTTMRGLGLARMSRIAFSYLRSSLRPIRPESNLEEFFINRFGRELYQTFFKSYTEKVWGVPCRRISAQWGTQRIKGVNIRLAVTHALKQALPRRAANSSVDSVAQKATETSLIEKFLYPKFGPGQMWEKCADEIVKRGGEIHFHWRVTRIESAGGLCRGVVATNSVTGAERKFAAECVFSSMPVVKLIDAMDDAPADVREIAEGLVYRDFITVGVLLRHMRSLDRDGSAMTDNWIYVQDSKYMVGRIQLFQNWSPWLVRDPSLTWLGLEYFCSKGDGLWEQPDDFIASMAVDELIQMGITDRDDVLDRVVLKVPKAYPAYWGSYAKFDRIRQWTDEIENLFLVGRNGMHRYNNQDHSMLSAMVAVDNIIAGRRDKSNIWQVNAEEDYHEEIKAESECRQRFEIEPVQRFG